MLESARNIRPAGINVAQSTHSEGTTADGLIIKEANTDRREQVMPLTPIDARMARAIVIAQHRHHAKPCAQAGKRRDACSRPIGATALHISDIITTQDNKIRLQIVHLVHDARHALGLFSSPTCVSVTSATVTG
ncbi:hypothetical protein L485_08590 [Sphingobium baderi LL03]|uniref:Uncharacterized protein n=1 Tax=Sphingobium baderi LL03 TaxID=1114964 RepID=T0GPZ2_9SPHN|nr:hypothetical protein L485_08590 [Sphingobium baderi LL03]